MKNPVKQFGGILLILIGASVLLSMIGIHLGGLIGLVIGAWLMYWGYTKYNEEGRWSFSSLFLLIIGTLIALGGLGGVFSMIVGIFLVYGGYRLMKPKVDTEEFMEEESPIKRTQYDVIDDEINKLLKNNN